MLLNQSHFIIENILKIEKKVLISKTSTTLPIRKNGWGTRIDVVKGAICPNFLRFLSFCALRGRVENKILLLA